MALINLTTHNPNGRCMRVWMVFIMPVFYTPIPQNLRVGLANVSGSVFLNNRTRDSEDLRDFNQDNEGETSVFVKGFKTCLDYIL